jgi:fucose 4-O-acetylase-like acetyltransferase
VIDVQKDILIRNTYRHKHKHTTNRLDWVDCCKGICIVLVVFGHITGGLNAAKLLPANSVYLTLRSWVYLFHMPAFFLLSGIFATKTLTRPWVSLLRNKTRSLVYPYILWTWIYMTAQMSSGNLSNNPPDVARALQLLWEPYGYGLWFLYSLFVISLLFHFFMHSGMRRSVILIVALGFHLMAWFNVFGFWPILNTTMQNLIYYAIGSLFASKIQATMQDINRLRSFALGILSLGLMTVLNAVTNPEKTPTELISALFGIVGAIGISHGLAGWKLGRLFSILGFFSLEIYLGHALFGSSARAIAKFFSIHSVFFHVCFGMTVVLICSTILAFLCQKLKFPYLYRWPHPRHATS